jgi:hypothetical protein
MKKENLNYLTTRVNCRPVNGLHYPSDYADHIERKRDKGWFLKIQRLEKTTKELREQMELLSKKYKMEVSRTQLITTLTQDINCRCLQRRMEIKAGREI